MRGCEAKKTVAKLVATRLEGSKKIPTSFVMKYEILVDSLYDINMSNRVKILGTRKYPVVLGGMCLNVPPKV